MLLWHSRSTLLTCHIAVVFYFCSSLQQGLTSAFLSVAVALWTEVGIVASQTSSHHWQWWFIVFQLFCLSLPILFDSVFILHVYFYMEGSFCRKEHSTVCASPASPATPASLMPTGKLVCALSSSNLPYIQESSFPLCQSSLHCLRMHMTLGMDGISSISFCSHDMFFQLCFRLNRIILLLFLRDTLLILWKFKLQGVEPGWALFCAGIY